MRAGGRNLRPDLGKDRFYDSGGPSADEQERPFPQRSAAPRGGGSAAATAAVEPVFRMTAGRLDANWHKLRAAAAVEICISTTAVPRR